MSTDATADVPNPGPPPDPNAQARSHLLGVQDLLTQQPDLSSLDFSILNNPTLSEQLSGRASTILASRAEPGMSATLLSNPVRRA